MTVNRKKTFLIIALCFSLVLMGAGYAILSSTLNITGTNTMAGKWNVKIKSITPTVNGYGESVSATINSDGLSASVAANLYESGDYVEYTVVVENAGNIPAKLSDIRVVDNSNNPYVAVTNDALIDEQIVGSSTSSFKIKFELVNPNDEEIPELIGNYYDIYLTYVQDTGV